MMLEYHVTARRIDSHGSQATTKQAMIVLDTDMAGRQDAFNPAEMLLASLAACILKGTERVIPMLEFDMRGIEVSIHGVRQDNPPKMISITYGIVVDTDESDRGALQLMQETNSELDKTWGQRQMPFALLVLCRRPNLI